MSDAVILGGIEMRPRTDLRGLRVFLASLSAHNPSVRVVVFNRSPEHEALARLLEEFDVESLDAQAMDLAWAIPSVEIEIARFCYYGAWLHDHDVSGVLMLDLLDVAFQDDPERLIPSEGMTVWQEHQRIGACPYNSKWIREVWGRERMDLFERPVVCCGVIAAESEAAKAYLAWYEHGIATRPVKRGFDTAMLAPYAYGTLDVHVEPFQNLWCMHLGYAPEDSVSMRDHRVWCDSVSPVLVHQYNRHPEVARELRSRWT